MWLGLQNITLDLEWLIANVSICTGKTIPLIIQEAMLEVAMRARELGCYNLLFLSDSNRAVQVTNRKWTPTWQERSLLVDWSHLELNNINCHFLHIPKSVISHVSSLAKVVTNSFVSCLFSGMVSKKKKKKIIYIYIYQTQIN